jgi:addiction module HigA family antidote
MKLNKMPAVHPGIILQENFLEPLGISQQRFAKIIQVPPKLIEEIVTGKRSIRAEIALRLAHYFGLSKRYWLNLQARYDAAVESD